MAISVTGAVGKDRFTQEPIISDGFVLGVTEPTWANSGCRIPQANLTMNPTTNLITSFDGQVISGLWLPNGRIEVRHKNVTIRDCIINIGWDRNRQFIQSNSPVVYQTGLNCSGLNIEFVTVDPINAGANGTADDAQVAGFYVPNGTRVYRCALHKVTDAVMPDYKAATPDAPCQILGNYLETRYFYPDPEHSDGTHNDGVQLAGGDGHIIRGNAIHGPSGGVPDPISGHTVLGNGVVFTPYHAPLSNITVDSNWFYGTYTQVSAWVSFSEGYGPDCPGTTITNNRHMGTCVWMILLNTQVNTSKKDVSRNVVGPGGIRWNNGFTAAGQPANVNVATTPA